MSFLLKEPAKNDHFIIGYNLSINKLEACKIISENRQKL
jgi:hypothetical protein